MILLVDIGNSFLKWTLADSGMIAEPHYLNYRESDFMSVLTQAWTSLSEPEQIGLAAVAAPEVVAKVLGLAQVMWPAATVVKPSAAGQAFGVTSAYVKPEKLGVDRWLAMIGALHAYPGANCIVDCGTAITVDFVAADGLHQGGLICPGLRLMKQALSANTHALPVAAGAGGVGLAADTDAAIDAGVLWAAVGLVETALGRQNQPYRLLLTGGDAAQLAEQLAGDKVLDSQLVFKGLLHYCAEAEASG
ncbi:type III pantothenate kinase [Methylomonas sp. EFPC3]|uniref:type III pantothenate kinase n=1 Tax=Methylomonas sp. EFPC3 TaxID=3021710 RepID=UPI002417A1F1|nr:type III pantothenate kinase [Methylomonas sp. EFPC3]WFP50804.1 type III pantothenate kinase [Methylomonas sp. EFPC3]